jgi:hypothetical protein
MLFNLSLRIRCRNPQCCDKLKTPTENPRDAFCCASCEASYYRTHCRVCQQSITPGTARRELCGKARCINEFRRQRLRFSSVWYPSPKTAAKLKKTSTKSRAKTGAKTDRADIDLAIRESLRQLDAEKTSVSRRTNLRYWREARQPGCLIQRHDPPVNILGGYKFPDAPKIDLDSPIAKAPPPPKAIAGDLIIPDDLSIPKFLRRNGGGQLACDVEARR